MDKKDLILKYFDRSELLTAKNRSFRSSLSSLFTWLTENDTVQNDRTSKLLGLKDYQTAQITVREDGVVAGLEEIKYLLDKYTSLIIKAELKDGQQSNKNQVIAEIIGKTVDILAYERTILNILQRMSGIATETKSLIKLISTKPYTLSPIPYLAATRKTPWMLLDKKAVAVGGGLTHRLSLSDGILIKDNHLKLLPIEEIFSIFLKKVNNNLIEVEVTNKEEAFALLSSFQPFRHSNHLAILLDNFTPDNAKETIVKLQKKFDLTDIIFEGSGGITKENIRQWAQTGVDFISLGSLTHSAKAFDMSLEF